MFLSISTIYDVLLESKEIISISFKKNDGMIELLNNYEDAVFDVAAGPVRIVFQDGFIVKYIIQEAGVIKIKDNHAFLSAFGFEKIKI